MAAPYGDGLYLNEPPRGNGLKIAEIFHKVNPKPDDPVINSAIDSQYPNVAIITFDQANQFGGLWAKEPLDLGQPFSMEMYLHLGHQHKKSGSLANGLTFTLHNDPAGLNAIGGAGEGLGVYKGRKWTGQGQYTVEHGTYLRNSLVIECDNCRNKFVQSAFVDDPGNEGTLHCALVIPHADRITVEDHQNVFYIKNSQQWLRFEVAWTPDNQGGGLLTYHFDGTQKTYTIQSIQSLFNGDRVYWGFTGCTGEHSSVLAAAITRLPEQGITVTKTVKDAAGMDINNRYVVQGETLTYTVRVTAKSICDPISTIFISDTISEWVHYAGGNVLVTTSSGKQFAVGSSYSDPVMHVNTTQGLSAEGDWLEMTFNVRVNPNTVGKMITNTAEISAEGLTEPIESNPTTVTVYAAPTKTVSNENGDDIAGKPVKLGDKITYTIHYANEGAAVAEIEITDELPKGVTFASAKPDGQYDGTTHTMGWLLKDIAVGATGSVSVTVIVNDSAVVKIINNAAVAAGEEEPQPTNDVENPVTPERPVKRVADNSAAGKNGSLVKAGDEITYSISYLNYTDADANITITDKLPNGVEFVSSADGKYSDATHTITWTIANVPSGHSGVVTAVVRVNEMAVVSIENYAAVKVGGNNPQFTTSVTNPMHDSNCKGFKQVTKCRKTIKGSVTWIDENDAKGIRPPSVDVALLRDDAELYSVSVSTKGNGKFSFGCLSKNKDSSTPYGYEVDSPDVPDGYTQTIKGYDIIFTRSDL